MIALAFLASCSKKDHDIVTEPASCQYAGKSYVSGYTYYNIATSETYNQDIIQTDDQLPLEIRTSNRRVQTDTIKNELVVDDTGNYLVQYKYDAEGYMTQETFTENRLQQGGPNYIILLFDIGQFKKVQTNSTRITDFRYENGLLKEATIRQTITYLPGNLSAITKRYQNVRKYNYDSQNSLISTEEIYENNYKSITNYKDGLVTSVQGIQPDGSISTFVYKNENGKKSQVTSKDGVENYKYDANGNLQRYESTYQGRLNNVQEYLYDNYVNPETLVSTRFKGIPTPFLTVQSQGGNNNLTRQKSTSYNNVETLISEENTSYVYNNAALPETSTTLMVTAGGDFTKKTTYKYTNCP